MAAASGNPEGSGAAVHVPVLMREVLAQLDLESGLRVVDGTVGAGGHSRRILDRIGDSGRLIGLDRDPYMLRFAASRLSVSNSHLVQASYAELRQVLNELQIERVDRILLDLGLSSDQLADAGRGFSFQAGGPLDLRFDTSRGEPAWQWLEQVDAAQLAEIIEEYGEDPFSRRIAEHLVQRRRTNPIRTAADLTEAVEEALPQHVRATARKQPATRVFQALRIAVNQELEQLDRFLGQVVDDCLEPGGRLVIISFHSLEDRRVKQALREKTRWQNLTPKPVTATASEQRANPRSRTAKLRAARKL